MAALLIRNGTILDGSPRAKPAHEDLLVERGRIERMESGLKAPGARVLDAAGMVVAPGFIDAHSHSDTNALLDSRAEGRLRDGVTTEINGTCGLSLFPLIGAAKEAHRGELAARKIEPDWTDAAGYFARVEKAGSAINRGFLVGHGAIRGAVVGYKPRPATRQEQERMGRLLQESLEQGALGLSSGLCYPPGCFAGTAELAGLCLHLKGRPYCTHMRNEGRELMRSLGEALAICRRGRAPLHVSHVKTFGRSNWWKIELLERALFEARRSGMDVTADRYPYTAAMTELYTIFPDRLMAGGAQEALKRLHSRPALARLKAEALRSQRKLVGEKVVISVAAEGAKEFEGLTLAQAGERLGMEPFEAAAELLRRAGMDVSAIFFEMSEENLARILMWPFVSIGSDSSARSLTGPTAGGKPHPRVFGSSARFLREYVLRRQLMPLAEGISRLTSLPAQRFGLEQRGLLRPGYHADIVVFDPKEISDAATYELPFQVSRGVRHLLVNGTPVIRDGRLTSATPGRILRR